MNAKPAKGLFITGTDTEVGKTYVAARITRDLARQGVAVGTYKPVCSGCDPVPDATARDDPSLLWKASGQRGTLTAVCPQRFAAPLAPPLAARHAGQQVDSQRILDGLTYWSEQCDFLIVEGAGGLLSPLTDTWLNADVASRMGYPLIVVAANRLGCVNHTLQTLVAAAAHRPPLPVAGIVLNQAHPNEAGDISLPTNRALIEQFADVPVLTEMAYGGDEFSESVNWLARC